MPRQGGTGHINEQWPEYWTTLFREREFFVLDPIRPKIFFDSRVQWVYRQNILMFVSVAHPRSDAFIATNTLEGASGMIEWVNHRIARPRVLYSVERLPVRSIISWITRSYSGSSPRHCPWRCRST